MLKIRHLPVMREQFVKEWSVAHTGQGLVSGTHWAGSGQWSVVHTGQGLVRVSGTHWAGSGQGRTSNLKK